MRHIILLGFGLAILVFLLIAISIRVRHMLKLGRPGALRVGINFIVITLLIVFIFVLSAATTHNYLYEIGTSLVHAGEYNKAIKMLGGTLLVRTLFRYTPQLLGIKVFSFPLFFAQEVDIRRNLAASYQGLEKYSNAMQEYKRMLSLGRDDFEATAGLGECSFLMRDFEGAKRYYQKLLTISHTKKDFDYYYIVGKAYMVLQDFENAIIHFKKALEFGNKQDIINRYLEMCYREIREN